MRTPAKGDFDSRLDAVTAEARSRGAAVQSKFESSRVATRDRFEQFLPIAAGITALAKAKLERLKERISFEVKPSHVQTERRYSRAITMDVNSDLASVIRLSFRLTYDVDISHILLDYDLEITPVFFHFVPHYRLDIPLDACDELVVDQWLDGRIVDFAKAFLVLSSTTQYQERDMVSDTVAGIRFPKHFAAATVELTTSSGTRREFAMQNGLSL